MLEYTPLISSAHLARGELRKLLGTTSHLLVGNILQASISVSQVASSGHLGSKELAAIGLAHVVVILTGYPMVFSVLSCLETCGSQSFGTNGDCIGYFVRAIQLQWMLGVPMGLVWFNCRWLLSWLVDDTLVELVVVYLRWYWVPFMVFGNLLCAKQTLYAQGITYPLPYLTLLGAVTTGGAQYLLVFSPAFKWGLGGVALGSGVGYLGMLLATLWLISRYTATWAACNARWSPMLRILPYGLLLSLFSTGTSELVTMAAAHLGPQTLAVQSVLSAISRMLMIASSSVGVAALNRTGNWVGARQPRMAKVAADVSMAMGLCCAVLSVIILAGWPRWWVGLFTSDPAAIQEAAGLIWVVAGACAGQSVAFMGSQILSAQGRQKTAVRIKLLSLYGIGIPLGYYLTFVKLQGLRGLWTAVMVGQLLTALLETLWVIRTDWTLIYLA